MDILKHVVKAIYPLVKAKRRFVKRAKLFFLKRSGKKTAIQSVRASNAYNRKLYDKDPVKVSASKSGRIYGGTRSKPRKTGNLYSILSHISPKALIASSAALVLIIALILILSHHGGQGNRSAIAGVSSPGPSASSIVPTTTPEGSATVSPSAGPSASPSGTTLKQGMSSPAVADIQQRLMDLNYMDDAEPTQLYGPATKQAVMLFQREEDLTVDGCLTPDTYAKLMAKDAPQYKVSIGDTGTDVKSLKDRLYELGYLNASSSNFDKDTEAAVKKFQQLNGLNVDGKIGENTMEMLYSDNVKANFFANGEKSDKVLACQKRLKTLGYLTTTPDGTYGADTINAVKRFQGLNGLIADGYLGPETIRILNLKSAQSNALILGMSGSDITRVQQRLISLKYMRKATGYYGSSTVNAIKTFQKQNKLTQDGKVGSHTMNVLMSPNAKVAPKNSGGGSGGSSGGGSGGDSGDSGEKGSVDKLISVAESKMGCKYVRGAKGPGSFDCSGFVYWCLSHAGVSQSYMTSASWQDCTKYQRIEGMGNLKRGDIISFKGHVGIYMGGGKMINALPDSGITVSNNITNSSYWTSHFVCGFRIF